jgi:hypothetical protein
MKMKVFALLLLVPIAAACGGSAGAGAGGRARPASLEARQVRPVDWARRVATDPLWPAGTRRLQIVVTPAWTAGEHFVWFVANGTNALRVFRTSGRELNALIDAALGDLSMSTVESPTASLWYGGAGSITKPPTPDPPPAPILPPGYVDAVMRLAWEMNENVAAGP